MKNKIITLLISFSFCMVFAQVQNIPDEVTKVATAAGNWLKLETSARAIGMGGAFVASGAGISGITYNPASVGFIEGSEGYYSKNNYLAGISHNVMAYGTRLSAHDYFAVHLFFLNSGAMDVTNENWPDGTGEQFYDKGWAFRGTYARTLTDRLKIGFTIKYVREKIYTLSMQSFAVDIGSHFDTGIYGVVLGMSVNNFGPEVQFYGEGLQQTVEDTVSVDGSLSKQTEPFPLPLSFRLGIKDDIIGPNSVFVVNPQHRLTFAIDGVNAIDYTVTGNVGLEYSWKEFAFARAGTHIAHDTAGWSCGAGVKLKNSAFSIAVDWAYADYGDLDYTDVFGITLKF